MLTSSYSGNRIVSFLGAHSFSNGPTYSIVEVEVSDPKTTCNTKKVWELYLTNESKLEIENNPKNFVCEYDRITWNDEWRAKAEALKCLIKTAQFWRSDITTETVQKLRDFYNDYYKYESWFKEI